MGTDMVPYEGALPNEPTEEKPRRYRREKYEELGFTREQAVRLADARDAKGFFVYWGDVQNVLQNGCDVDTAFDIFSDQVPS